MLYYIPIEPLEERYTEQWYREYPDAFKQFDIHVTVIDGEALTNSIEVGAFLDLNSTMYYKASQVQKIARLFHEKKIKHGDSFFIADIEFPGIEAIKYMAHLQDIHVSIYGFLHAASYTIEDFFAKASSYGQFFEKGWIEMCDKVFVATEYHKRAVVDRRDLTDKQAEKIVVTGNPLPIADVRAKGWENPHDRLKDKTVIFSNRFDYEKRPNLFLDLATILKAQYPDWTFLVTTSSPSLRSNSTFLLEHAQTLERNGIVSIKTGLSKGEYYQELAKSAIFVSTTIEENFGYCTLEAMCLNTLPVVPKAFSHPELLGKDWPYMYNNLDELLAAVRFAMCNKVTCTEKDFDSLISRYTFKSVVKEMIKHF